MTQITATNPLEEFQQRVIEKMKLDIGALMPDEALAKLTARAVEEIFFKRERIAKPGRSYNSNEMVDLPSWFQREVAKAAEPLIAAAVEKCVVEQRAEIDRVIAEELSREKLLLATAACIGQQVRDGFSGMAQEMISMLKSQGIIISGNVVISDLQVVELAGWPLVAERLACAIPATATADCAGLEYLELRTQAGLTRLWALPVPAGWVPTAQWSRIN